MPKIKIIPCLSDNYAYLIVDEQSKKNILIDAPEAGPILDCLKKNSLNLDYILLTHHHPDHIDGVEELRKKYNLRVVGAKRDKKRLPGLDIEVEDGQTIDIGEMKFNVIDVDGHTVGHVAFICVKENIGFTGDSLMVMGCGRLFEDTPEKMYESMEKFKKFSKDMKIYSGHEYTKSNIEFALSIDKDNPQLRDRHKRVIETLSENEPTIPSTLREEYETNPFLRQDDPSIVKTLKMETLTSSERFAKIRSLKDNF
ncbi:hydroxyacylglutathione hydrolase [bacterium TMED277]|nr:MAG: hydroxyacylglutathione hydrolase [bacterium TMED277]|tara:strand:+ start:1688 stop:2452 length:765 start_codon:yes stop_codon:yes gene_type:complete